MLGRELLRIALLQGMGSALQLIPQPGYRDTGSPWHWCDGKVAEDARRFGSHPFVGVPVLGPPGHMRYLNLAVWGQGTVSCPLLAHVGDRAAGRCGSHPSWVLGWVFHAGGQAWLSLIDVKTWVRNAPGPEDLTVFLSLVLYIVAVPLPEPDGSYLSSREGVRGAETGRQRTHPQHRTEMSPRLSFKAVPTKPSGPLSRAFRRAEVGLEHFMRAPGACEPIHF